MSKEQFKAFRKALVTDSSLREKMKGAKNGQEVTDIANQEGFDFTVEEWEEAPKLNPKLIWVFIIGMSIYLNWGFIQHWLPVVNSRLRQDVPAGYKYLNQGEDSVDGDKLVTLYWSQKIEDINDKPALSIFWQEPVAGDKGYYKFYFDCKKNIAYDAEIHEATPLQRQSIGEAWLQKACK